MTKVFTPELVDAAIVKRGRGELRRPLLPAPLTNAWKEAIQEARSRLLPLRSGRDWPRALKQPMRWPFLRTRSGRSKVEPRRWAHNQTTKQREHRGAGRPVPRAQPP
ncbi:hypothetical protein ACFTY7_40270 [Streptomyces sp. NPDC057062]|uniref:hypothetical protein n=1 Tax=unclassified Streptomyces TaxID=2593676 RepID=UPI001C6ED126|nr:hypothetical protein [Streptomyces sp. MBT84]